MEDCLWAGGSRIRSERHGRSLPPTRADTIRAKNRRSFVGTVATASRPNRGLCAHALRGPPALGRLDIRTKRVPQGARILPTLVYSRSIGVLWWSVKRGERFRANPQPNTFRADRTSTGCHLSDFQVQVRFVSPALSNRKHQTRGALFRSVRPEYSCRLRRQPLVRGGGAK